jgi:hypothetical protein
LRFFENSVLEGIFACKRYEVTGERRKLDREELHNLYSFQNIIWVIRLKIMRWAGYVAFMRDVKCIQNFSLKT